MKANIGLLSFFLYFIIVLNNIPAKAGTRGPQRLRSKIHILPSYAFFDANRIGAWISNVGEFTSNEPEGNRSGMFWPRGTTKTINYQSGIWIAGLVGGDVRTAAAEYASEYRGGTYESYPGNVDDPRFRIYSIDRFSRAGDTDWDEWSVTDGAPVDSFGNPVLLGDKTYWSLFHDADSSVHEHFFSTDPMGIEVHMTIWGFDQPGVFGDVMFINFRIFNKGDNLIEDAYIGPWADHDIGAANDDLFGTDTLHDMGYGYNQGSDQVYGDGPPAIGFKILRGVYVPSPGDTAIAFGQVIPGYKNVQMFASRWFITGGFPGTGGPDTPSEAYFAMKGLDNFGNEKLDDLGAVTRYDFTGDPVTGTGWLLTDEDDMTFLVSSGPFTLASGDSQELTMAVLIAQDTSALSSITKLREVSKSVQDAFEKNFQQYEATLLFPNGGERFTEEVPVSWESSSDDGTILNAYFSALSYFGVTYPLAEGLPASGTASIDVSALADGRYLLKVEAYDSLLEEFSFYQADFSDSLITIDNPGNSKPFIEIESDFTDVLKGDFEIGWTAIDFEDSTLTISISYSVDRGTHWEPIAEEIPNSGSYIWITWDSPNSDSAMISLTAFDGDSSATIYSALFELKNRRQKELDDVFTNLIGRGQGPLTLNVIDSTLLTGNNYKLSFREDVTSGDIVYDVFDLDEGVVEITGAFEIFGTEGPLFDGMRLSIFDFPELSAWKTEWIVLIEDTSSYGVEFLPYRAEDSSDFEVRFLGEGADSSINNGKPVPFQIWNVSAVPHEKVDLYIVPTVGEWASGNLILFGSFSWILIFTWDETDTPPQTGDVLKLFTGRPREAGDVIVFNSEGAPIGIDGENEKIPDAFNLAQNYPNPFNPLTNIQYSLPVRSEVSLIIYNLRGQVVARLVDGEKPAGIHTAVWNAATAASGLYFYRLQAGNYVKTKKMVLLK